MKFFSKLSALVLVLCITFSVNIYASSVWTSNFFDNKSVYDIVFYNNNYYCISDNIYIMTDDGLWAEVFKCPSNNLYTNFAVLNNNIIAYGNDVQPIISKNGVDWNYIRLHPNMSFDDVKTLGKYFFYYLNEQLLYSDNMLVWNNLTIPTNSKVTSSRFFKDKCIFKIQNNNNSTYLSLNPEMQQQNISIPSSLQFENVFYLEGSGLYASVAATTYPISKKLFAMYSTDGITWSKKNIRIDGVDLNAPSNYISYSVGGKLFIQTTECLYVSSDAQKWIKVDTVSSNSSIKYSGKYFYNISDNNILHISSDGIVWYSYPLASSVENCSKLFVNDTIFAISFNMNNTTIYSYKVEDITQPINNIINYSGTPTKDTEEVKRTITLQIGSNNMYLTDKSVVILDATPIIKNGVTLVPIRAIIDSVGGTVEWNPQSKKISLTSNNINLEMWLDTINLLINHQAYTFSCKPTLINETTMVPLRDIMEALNYTVNWNSTTQEITIFY